MGLYQHGMTNELVLNAGALGAQVGVCRLSTDKAPFHSSNVPK